MTWESEFQTLEKVAFGVAANTGWWEEEEKKEKGGGMGTAFGRKAVKLGLVIFHC